MAEEQIKTQLKIRNIILKNKKPCRYVVAGCCFYKDQANLLSQDRDKTVSWLCLGLPESDWRGKAPVMVRAILHSGHLVMCLHRLGNGIGVTRHGGKTSLDPGPRNR